MRLVSSDSKQFGFSRKHRLRGKRAFDCVFARRCSAADERLVVFVHRNSVGHPRLGLSVGRKHGGAVRRHRIKRLLREAFRLTRAELPPEFDVVCVPRVAEKPTLADYQESLPRLTRRAAERWDKHEDWSADWRQS